jgi:putative addiction module killer protein
MIEVREYLEGDGRSPFAEWLDHLHAPAAAKATVALYRLESGNFSNVKGVGSGVFEYRIDFGPGYRIFFGKDGEKRIILPGRWQQAKTKPRYSACDAVLDRLSQQKEGIGMALTRDFRESIVARMQKDRAYRRSLLKEGVDCLLSGDLDAGKSLLRDYIKATRGFPELAEATGIPAKSLIRMFGPSGNPHARNLFLVVAHLQTVEGIRLRVKSGQAA